MFSLMLPWIRFLCSAWLRWAKWERRRPLWCHYSLLPVYLTYENLTQLNHKTILTDHRHYRPECFLSWLFPAPRSSRLFSADRRWTRTQSWLNLPAAASSRGGPSVRTGSILPRRRSATSCPICPVGRTRCTTRRCGGSWKDFFVGEKRQLN